MFLWTFLACVVSAEPAHDEVAAGKKFQHLFWSLTLISICLSLYAVKFTRDERQLLFDPALRLVHTI